MWNWFINLLTQILEGLASIVGDWGLAIIILTVIIRLLLTPLTIKSTKSNAKMQVLQPKLLEIQERYADDPQRMQQEMQKFYSENKFNPFGGCLPLIFQMPVFFALFSVLKAVPEVAHFYNIFDSLATSPNEAVSTLGFAGAWLYIVFDLGFGLLTLIPMMLNTQQDSQQASQTRLMSAIMAIMMIWIGWSCPVGVLLYYVTSSAWGVVQQVFITRRVMDKAKAEEAERMKDRPVNVDVVRKERKARPHKKG